MNTDTVWLVQYTRNSYGEGTAHCYLLSGDEAFVISQIQERHNRHVQFETQDDGARVVDYADDTDVSVFVAPLPDTLDGHYHYLMSIDWP